MSNNTSKRKKKHLGFLIPQNLSTDKSQQPKQVVYADASYDKVNHDSVISYSSSNMLISGSKLIKAKDNNDAELKAIYFACKNVSTDVEIKTDSEDAMRRYKGEHTVTKWDRENSGNSMSRFNHEDHRRKTRYE